MTDSFASAHAADGGSALVAALPNAALADLAQPNPSVPPHDHGGQMPPIDQINKLMMEGCMAGHLGIEVTAVSTGYVEATMPLSPKTAQPYGVMHGGASAALAETIGSLGSMLAINGDEQMCYGIELNCNHIMAARTPYVVGKATALHLGRTTHVWEIKITDATGRLTCIARHTTIVVAKPPAHGQPKSIDAGTEPSPTAPAAPTQAH